MKENIYDWINRNNPFDENIDFFNHGYLPLVSNKINSKLLFTSYNLYEYMYKKVSKFDNVLEIGCGRGGGYKVLKNIFPACPYVGIDINASNIEYCRHVYSNGVFLQMSAENFSSQINDTFDVILNIESSHCYDSLDKFFSNVHDSMHENSVFLYADCFDDFWLDQTDKEILKYFDVIERTDITKNVYHSCVVTTHMIESYLKTNNDPFYADWLLDLFKDKARVYGERKALYFSYVLKKKTQ